MYKKLSWIRTLVIEVRQLNDALTYRYIILASGLELSGGTCDALASLEMAVAWIVGDAGEMEDQVIMLTNLRFDLSAFPLSKPTLNCYNLARSFSASGVISVDRAIGYLKWNGRFESSRDMLEPGKQEKGRGMKVRFHQWSLATRSSREQSV
jgi:hypothetical protein